MQGGESDGARTGARDPYRELFERSADAILIIEGDTFVDCNEATVRMLGYATREEVLQTHPSELSPPRQPDGRDSYEKANEMIRLAFEGGSHRFEWSHRRADGRVFPVEVLLTAVEESTRRTLHVVWRDITERKKLEEDLRQASKMEAIGKLAGGIAHDFNNLLVAVLGHADLLESVVGDRPAAAGHLREIRRASERAADLVRQLLAFGRKQQLLPVVVDLNALTLDLRRLLERVIGEDVSLTAELAGGVIPIKVDRTQIEQVLMNLVTNARDAMPEGGELRVRTRRARTGEAALAEFGDLRAGEYALLSVTDTGTGMSHEVVSRAFDPFFTTKEAGSGTGLGLATVYGIVTQSGGAVLIHSSPGEGSRVEVALPTTDEALAASRSVEAAAEPEAGGATILLVEDEPAVAQLVRHALETREYEVLVAENGRLALELYEREAARIDLVLSDVIMPELSGPRMLAELLRRGHRPHVLFMSGYTNQAMTILEDLGGEVDIIEKPFDVRELLRRVRSALPAGS